MVAPPQSPIKRSRSFAFLGRFVAFLNNHRCPVGWKALNLSLQVDELKRVNSDLQRIQARAAFQRASPSRTGITKSLAKLLMVEMCHDITAPSTFIL